MFNWEEGLSEEEEYSAESQEDLQIVPVPALVAVLYHKESEKGSPLTEAEVLEIRDKAACIAMPRFAFLQVEAQRGYRDINPDFAWEEWQQVRHEFG